MIRIGYRVGLDDKKDVFVDGKEGGGHVWVNDKKIRDVYMYA
jgi:hypothetical protein